MPEGPEVHRIGYHLSQWLWNMRELHSVNVVSGRYLTKPIENFIELTTSLPLDILEVGVKGKFIFISLERDWYIFNSLGMTGYWTTNPQRHPRIVLEGKFKPNIIFDDVRQFGTLKFVKGKVELEKKLNSLGPDILNKMTETDFRNRLLKKKDKEICRVLLDQSVVSGIGNYLKAEILYQAHISPYRLIKDLSNQEFKTLHFYSTLIPIACFRAEWELQVYNRDITSDGEKVIREETPDGRTTHWVPSVQL